MSTLVIDSLVLENLRTFLIEYTTKGEWPHELNYWEYFFPSVDEETRSKLIAISILALAHGHNRDYIDLMGTITNHLGVEGKIDLDKFFARIAANKIQKIGQEAKA
jgi:hypothetical protein